MMADSLVWASAAPRTVVSMPYVNEPTRSEFTFYLSQVDEIIERTNRNRRGRPKYEPEAVHDKVDAVRRQGYASVYDVISAVGSITMAIPSPYSETQHVLGIGGFSERVKASEGDYVKQLKSAINGIKRAIKSDHK